MTAFLHVIIGAVLGILVVGLSFFFGLRGKGSRRPEAREGSTSETVYGSSIPNTFGD